MELPNLLQNSLGDVAIGDSLSGGQKKAGERAEQTKAAQLAQSAQVLNQEAVNAYENQQLDHRFRLNPSLFQALEKAMAYMNRTLEKDGLEMRLAQDENGVPISAQVVDQDNQGNVVKEYDPQEVLRYYAHSGYGTGVIVDGKI